MKIGAPKETAAGEARVALTPDSAVWLQKLGYECMVETGAGKAAGFSDTAYAGAGVTLVASAKKLWADSDIILKVRPPD
ncbi:MAG: NAD(P)(+) transhydrogenase (Re/Si-specific) subunit alpha, partial [Alphaproteobacteria bacterium]|nr:NAD(P)(+) transhydrogenase (Re/Si-specific) subunit alpha [Alphaproteobacteria bacterium]